MIRFVNFGLCKLKNLCIMYYLFFVIFSLILIEIKKKIIFIFIM